MTNSRNSNGFGAIELLLILIVVGLVGFVGYYALSKKNKTDKAAMTNKTSSPEQTNNSTKPADPPADKTATWKTFKSPLSGYTVKYPSEWVVQVNGEVFKNNLGGVSHTFILSNTKRTGSYDGHDANTYMCVAFDEYSVDGWQKSPRNTANFTAVDRFKSNANTELVLALEKSDQPMLSSLVVSNGTNDYISLNSKYELKADARFNCTQGDYQALENSKEDFLTRPETATAKDILKTIRY